MAYAGKETSAVGLAEGVQKLYQNHCIYVQITIYNHLAASANNHWLNPVIHFHENRITLMQLLLYQMVFSDRKLIFFIFFPACLFSRCFVIFEHVCVSLSAGKTWFLKSPLDGKDGEGAAMVERTASCRYPSVAPHQGECVFIFKLCFVLVGIRCFVDSMS